MKKKNTILVAEDNALNRKILAKILADEYEVLEAENGRVALEVLAAHPEAICAVILDLTMPVMNGFEFLAELRRRGIYEDIPVLVATGDSTRETEEHALELGAWDFVSKPYQKRIILLRLQNAIAKSRMAAFEQLKYLAEFDTLTGIHNQQHFLHEVREALREHTDRKRALVRFDINRFQLINNFFGNARGDEVLCYIARLLKQEAPRHHLFLYGRMGADVFAFFTEYKDRDTLHAELGRLREDIRGYDKNFDILPTFGVCYVTDPNQAPAVLLDNAALAGKASKGNYIHPISEYTKAMSDQLEREQKIVNEMSVALAERQFCVYLQPKYRLSDDTICGAEALVRWKHPEQGMISPNDFVPVFEKNGFIANVDFFIWEEVCRFLREELDRGKTPSPVSVNMSRVNMYNPRIVEIVDELVHRYDIPPALLELEVTESAYMDNPQIMQSVVDALHDRGYVVLMDDFGSGYSSLGMLKNINVDVLKIDMRFMEESKIAGRGENVVASIVRMAKWLNIPVVAEGVEEEQQVQFLRSIGCECIQGFYFARPMPVADYRKLSEKAAPAAHAVPEQQPNLDRMWSTDSDTEFFFSHSAQASNIFAFDGSGTEVLRVNSAYVSLMGSGASAICRNQLERVLPEDRQRVRDFLQRCADSHLGGDCEFQLLREDGRVVWIHQKCQYMSRTGGQDIFCGTFMDVTVQKKMELRLRAVEQSFAQYTPGERTMLIVDDSEVSRAALAAIFADRFTILEAGDGVEGLEQLRQKGDAIDVILLDSIMPRMDGEEFLRQKQTLSEGTKIPVVIISAQDSESAQVNMLKMGVQDYITKPFIRETVERRVQNVLESSAHEKLRWGAREDEPGEH